MTMARRLQVVLARPTASPPAFQRVLLAMLAATVPLSALAALSVRPSSGAAVVDSFTARTSSHRNGLQSAWQTSVAVELQCQPCEKLRCVPMHKQRLECAGGMVLGICNCCYVCARVEGERCGGLYNHLGRCDAALECVGAPTGTDYDQRNPGHGICRPVEPAQQRAPGRDESVASDQPLAEPECQPPCTPAFCTKNPKAICSATENAEVRRACGGGTCQHTSCRACRFVEQREEPCERCEPDDFRCLARFGKCVKRRFCAPRRHLPCRRRQTAGYGLPLGKFQCLVPECP